MWSLPCPVQHASLLPAGPMLAQEAGYLENTALAQSIDIYSASSVWKEFKVGLTRRDTFINPQHTKWRTISATRGVQTIRQHLAGEGGRGFG